MTFSDFDGSIIPAARDITEDRAVIAPFWTNENIDSSTADVFSFESFTGDDEQDSMLAEVINSAAGAPREFFLPSRGFSVTWRIETRGTGKRRVSLLLERNVGNMA